LGFELVSSYYGDDFNTTTYILRKKRN